MEKQNEITYDFLKERGLILFECVVGSQAYGTNTENSDEDYKFVYILPEENIYGLDYIDQITVNKDHMGWELKRFLELLMVNNPTALEFLYSPEDCVIYKDDAFDLVLNNKDKFLSKICANSFGGYARQQLIKAKNLNKKQNWEMSRVERKDCLDFVYVIEGGKSVPWKLWNSGKGYEEKFCGLVKLPNARDVYAVYFDDGAFSCFSEIFNNDIRDFNKEKRRKLGLPMGFGYKGLVKVDETKTTPESNQLRLSSIPKGEEPICNIFYNMDGYTSHCKDFREYQDWLEKRNVTRWVEVKSHGQQLDGKNLLHCVRLIRMAKEIGEEGKIKVRRDDREFLLSIRRGEVDLKSLIELADEEIKNMEEAFKNSDLPEIVDKNFVNELLIEVRKQVYQ